MHRIKLAWKFLERKLHQKTEWTLDIVAFRYKVQCKSKVFIFIGWWCLITWSFSWSLSIHSPFYAFLSAPSSENRGCICGYNNNFMNLRSHVIKVLTGEKKKEFAGERALKAMEWTKFPYHCQGLNASFVKQFKVLNWFQNFDKSWCKKLCDSTDKLSH